MKSIFDKWIRLKDKGCREAYTEAQIDVDVPFQIAAMAHSRKELLPELAEAAGVPLSHLEGKRRISTNTLCRLAAHLDVALIVKFAAFSEAMEWERNFDPSTFNVRSFSDEWESRSQMSEHVAFLISDVKGDNDASPGDVSEDNVTRVAFIDALKHSTHPWLTVK